MNSHTWTIGRRIAALSACLLAITILLGAGTYISLSKVRKEADAINMESIPGLALSAEIKSLLSEGYIRTLLVGYEDDTAKRQKLIDDFKALALRNRENLEKYKGIIGNDPERLALYQNLQTAREKYNQQREAFFNLIMQKKTEEANNFLDTNLRPAYIAYTGAGEALFVFHRTEGIDASSSIATNARQTNLAIAVGSIICVIVGIILSWGVSRKLQQKLLSLSNSLESGATQVASASRQVSSASQTLASGSTEQAASLEETSASLEEMSSMVKRNADNASRANQLAKQARESADLGATEMQSMTSSMDEIQRSSAEISQIIKTIDEIAFQTNILALNAAVEAARAGEAGMGFAVVADEVRNLAHRSAEAAKETAQKIEGAIHKTKHGVDISSKVQARLQEILEKVRTLDGLVAEVAEASKEQSQGITQVNSAVGQMDKVTQNNAASAEESASASTELNAQAFALKEAVDELVAISVGRKAVNGQATTQQESFVEKGQTFQAKLGNKTSASALS